MEPFLISIVIPVYNVEKYIRDCLETIVNQSYHNIDIIIINDGSTDKSGLICDEFAKTDKRIRVVHQENKGLSFARNVGIKKAKGAYISFVDSDDMLSPFFIERLVCAIDGCDISCCDFEFIEEQCGFLEKKKDNTDLTPIRFTNIEALKEVYYKNYKGMDLISCSKLYRLTLFTDYRILFPEGKLHEDTFTTYRLFYYSKNISYIKSNLYFYRQRTGSITNGVFNVRHIDEIYATREECDFFLENKEVKLLYLSFREHLHKNKLLIRDMINQNENYRIQIMDLCKGIRKDIKKYNELIRIPNLVKVYYLAMSFFPFLSFYGK